MGAGQGLIAADVLTYLSERAHLSLEEKLEKGQESYIGPLNSPILGDFELQNPSKWGHREAPTELSGTSQPSVDAYRDFWGALHYIIIEKAQGLIVEQQHHLKRFHQDKAKVSWATLETLPKLGVTGCFFSNELVDALPVHQVVWQEGELQEVYVEIAEQQHPQPFVEILDAPSTAKLAKYLSWLGIDLNAPAYAQGYRSEINLAALDWLQAVAAKLQRGYLLTIDYGYNTAQYYHPARVQGTLQCYRRHAIHDDPYAYIGHQDITAHVNFTALETYGTELGLKTMGWTQQGLFLMALGLGDRLVANNNTQNLAVLSDVIRRRDALHALINPMGLGNFLVLMQSKDCDDGPPLTGLRGDAS